MGLKELAARAGSYQNIQIRDGKIQRGIGKKEEHTLAGVSAAVEAGSALQSRVTLTRMAAIGLFALAAKKTSGGEMWLVIEGPDFAWTAKVDRKDIESARLFANAVNNAARQS